MATMKAALHNGNGAVDIVDAPLPEVGPGEVVVRVRCAGICGTDLNRYAANNTPETLPSGHEVAGEVVEVGPGAEGWRIGDRVAIDTLAQGRGCGRCWHCLRGQYNTCQNKGGEGGGFAEYIKRLADGCFRLPEGLSWEEGALVEPLAVGVHCLRRGNLAAGETVVVLGSGTIGLTTLVAARALGAGKVFLTARHPQQTEMAMRLGADAAVPSDGGELWESVAAATDGRGADVVVETVGGANLEATLKQAVEVARPQGRIVVQGIHHAPVPVNMLAPLLKEQSIIFSQCYSVLDGRHDYEIAIDLYATNGAPLKDIVTHTFPLSDMEEALRTAGDKKTGAIKVQVAP